MAGPLPSSRALRTLRSMGVRGTLRSATLSMRHCRRPDRLVLGPRVSTDVHPGAELDLPSPFVMGVTDSAVAHYRVDRSTLAIDDGGRLRTTPEGFGRIGPGSKVKVEGEFAIGDSFVNGFARILAEERITIGSGCAIAWNVTLLDSDRHHLVVDGEPLEETAPIAVGDDVWIGHDVTIKKGVTVGDGAVVASNSVVTEDVPPGALVAGVPARVMRESVEWEQ